MIRHLTATPHIFLLSAALGFIVTTRAGQTTCSSTNTDWYTNVVGETPCTTYQRLRQICNADYQVGTLTRNTPPDHCDDQLVDCCCNTISFGLSMLCLACQDNSANGFDAGVGAYTQYLMRSNSPNTCGTGTIKALPDSIQSAVCNQKIKIEDPLYTLFWDTGEWFYQFSRDEITKDNLANNNNTFTHCESTWNNITTTTSAMPSTTTTGTTPTTSSSTTGTSAPQGGATKTKTLATGAIAGIAVGGVAIIAAIILGIVFYRRSQRRKIARRRRESFDAPSMSHVNMDNVGPDPDPRSAGTTSHFTSTYPAPQSAYTIEPWRSPAPPGSNSSGVAESSSGLTGLRSSKSDLLRSQAGARTAYADSAWGDESEQSMPNVAGGSGSHGHTQSSASLMQSERHVDAGPMLGRSNSGRLPPAYGDFDEPSQSDGGLNRIGATAMRSVTDLGNEGGDGSQPARRLSTRKVPRP